MSGSNIVALKIKRRSPNARAEQQSPPHDGKNATSLEGLLVALNEELVALEKQLVRIGGVVHSLGMTPKAREMLAEHERISQVIADIKRNLQVELTCTP